MTKNKIMNTKQIKSSFFFIICIMIIQVVMGYKPNIARQALYYQHQDSTIIGTWVSVNDNNWRFKFNTDSTCSSIYLGDETYNYTYKISNTSPQCGQTVDINQYSNYLQLINVNDSTDNICYLLNGITNKNLSLSPIDQGGAFVFVKQ